MHEEYCIWYDYTTNDVKMLGGDAIAEKDDAISRLEVITEQGCDFLGYPDGDEVTLYDQHGQSITLNDVTLEQAAILFALMLGEKERAMP